VDGRRGFEIVDLVTSILTRSGGLVPDTNSAFPIGIYAQIADAGR
jgi:hypothetical protein